MIKEFKDFIAKGNVMDMAVGVIIGAAFSDIVTALTSCFIQPLLNLIGGAEVKGRIPLGTSGQFLDYGTFLTAVINFFIIAFVLFMMIKAFNAADKRSKERLQKISAKIGKKKSSKDEEPEKEPETKLCPHCLSEIPYKATKCSHCTSDLSKEKTK